MDFNFQIELTDLFYHQLILMKYLLSYPIQIIPLLTSLICFIHHLKFHFHLNFLILIHRLSIFRLVIIFLNFIFIFLLN
jgi:hypothetical protein